MIYIFDLDGTLADISHRLHHIQQDKPNWDAFFAACTEDEPINEIITILKNLTGNHLIHIVTGRNEDVREETEAWLTKHRIHVDGLHMRKSGDRRPDIVVKYEWLQKFPHAGEIACVFEDRQGVVDMWREEGLICCQVAPGDF